MAGKYTMRSKEEKLAIDITFGENTVSHSDKTWISEIIADISSSEPTKKESVQDCPQVESYIKIDFQFETGTSTIFAYEDSGKYYIEQPYQGIYKIAMMRVFGYSQKECCRAILGGYRPLSYIGFIIGTVYQYGLLRLMVDIVFKDVEGVPTYKFDFPTMLISLACFITIYEIMMYIYSEKIKKISIKEIMIE